MMQPKKKIYIAALFVSLPLLCIYTVSALQASHADTQERLEFTLRETGDALQQAVARHSLDILFELDAYADFPADPDAIPDLLLQLEEAHPDIQFFVADSAGGVVGPGGQPAAPLEDLQPLRDARLHGYTVLPAASGGKVAYIVPLPGHGAQYLIQVEPARHFVQTVQESFGLSTSYAAVFGDNGAPVAGLFWGDADDSYALAQSVLHGATDYLSGQQGGIQQLPLQNSCNLFIPLAQPDGWFVGARVPLSAIPRNGAALRMHLLLLPLWAVGAVSMIAADILNDRRRRETITALGNLDPLTQLTNGAGMETAMAEYFATHPSGDYSMVVLDIVAFHRIIALYGHAVGDSLLCLLADVLRKHFICPARMYGDVFAFLGKTSPVLVADVERQISTAIGSGLGKPYRKMISFKFGVYPILPDNQSFRQIIDGAQLALRDAKKTPKLTQVIYDGHLQQIANLRRNIEANMLNALSQREFVPFIQPKFHILAGTCCGGEILVRWQSAELGKLMPDSFIPLFEDNGFIVEIDFYMLHQAMRILRRQLDTGLPALPLSVNMSRVTIAFPTFLERLENLVHTAPIPLELLEIEITESALEHDHNLVISLMHSMKKTGLRVALDDFGSGFSSLTSLRDLPVDVLKIDKAFFQESGESHKSRKIIRSILGMAAELQISVVCEGVETAQHVAFLQQCGDVVAQGYYYSRPVPCEQYESTYLKEFSHL